MRLFGSDRIVKYMEKMGLEEGQELEHPLLNRSIEQAQKRVEQHNFQIRKRTLEYDDVMNKQREVIYGWRNEAINSDDPRPLIYEVIDEAIPEKVISFLPPDDEKNSEIEIFAFTVSSFLFTCTLASPFAANDLPLLTT